MPDKREGDATKSASAAQQQNGGNFFNPFAIELPHNLDFWDPADWKRWGTRWERYRPVPSLHLRDKTMQVNMFLYAMGKEAEDILVSIKLTGAEMANYATV